MAIFAVASIDFQLLLVTVMVPFQPLNTSEPVKVITNLIERHLFLTRKGLILRKEEGSR